MAVTDDRIYHPTDALILQKPSRHYRVGLRVEHWQLRSQIGLSTPRYVYYVAGNGNTQVHRLDTNAQESEIIKILTFAPRCLVSKNGWVCCGGENGEFVAFSVNEGGDDVDRRHNNSDSVPSWIRNYVSDGPRDESDRDRMLDAFRHHSHGLSADDRLQLGLDAASDNPAALIPPLNPASPRPDSNSSKTLVARSKQFGRERVNCITLWFPPKSKDDRYSGAYSHSVAILANNDKTVTIVGLEDQETVDEIPYPDCVNRALISPDGRLLAGICDDPYLYIHEQVPKQTTSHGLFARKDGTDSEWRQCAKIHLKSQRKEDRSDQRGSFAACFSHTGRYLAVGTQYGVISVFDCASLLQPGVDPLITTFTSSKPREDVGAVRDMEFCPGPFDLLAWTEHRGHVGIADVRSNYISRQILNIDSYDDYEQIMVTERASIDPRLLERSDNGEWSVTDAAAGRSRRSTRAQLHDYNSPLTAEETMVLEALQEHRRRREQANARNNASAGSNASRLIERLQNRAAATGRENVATLASNDGSSRFRSELNNARRVSDILGDMHSQRERLRDQSDRIREASERVRARRLAVDEAERRRLAEGGTPLRAGLRTPLVLLPQSNESTRQILTSNSYTDLEALYQSAFDGDRSGPGNNPYEPGQGESMGNRLRENRDYLASVWSTILRDRDTEADSPPSPPSRLTRTRLADRVVLDMNPRSDREHDDTAGLAWSEDGRVLIVAALDGIYEFHVNLFGRKGFPSITMR